MNALQLNGQSIHDSFRSFHKENPHVFRAFEKQVFRAINAGKTKIGAKAVIEWIRWETFLTTTSNDFRINNNFVSYYARLFASLYPQHREIFNFRELRS